MRFWKKRRPQRKAANASLSLEKLEDRAMMAVIPLVSGQATTFRDADGTKVTIQLSGPGSGTVELLNGALSGAAIDTLTLNGTTGASSLKIAAQGGRVAGTKINDLVINKALNELWALDFIKAKKVDIANSGHLTADGNINEIFLRNLGSNASVEIDGNVGKVQTQAVGSGASVEVAERLRVFVAKLLYSGAEVSADQLDLVKVTQQAQGAAINAGDGGLGMAQVKNLYNSAISSTAGIGQVIVKGDIMASTLAANVDKGSDELFGTLDDFVIDSNASGNIGVVNLQGRVGKNGTNQQVDVITSGDVGQVNLSRRARSSGGPAMWLQTSSAAFPLSVVQAAALAAGVDDDQIWIAVFGQELGTGSKANGYFYLDPSQVKNGVPTPVSTKGLITPSPTTSNLPTLPSFTLSDWKSATNAWGSNLALHIPRDGNKWSGRILISVGAPVQAQVNAKGAISSPSASDPIDPATGTFYDFLEFTAVGKTTTGTGPNIVVHPPSLDIDTSLVDSFGLPMKLQLFQQNPMVTSFTGTLAASSPTITGITDTTGLAIGQSVVGTNIPLGATILSVTPNTMSLPGTVTLSMKAGPGASGSETLTAAAWAPYTPTIGGTLNPNSNLISNIDSDMLDKLVKHDGLGTGQPIFASGFLPPETAIESYVIGTGNGGSITLTKNALSTIAPNSSVTFTINTAGPVGVEATRHSITGTGAGSLFKFLKEYVDSGVERARPFLETAAPFLLSGPATIQGVSINAAKIKTASVGSLAAGDVVTISGVTGTTSLNGNFVVGIIESDGFTLGGPTGNGTYTPATGLWNVPGGSQFAITGATNGTTSAIQISTANTMGLVAGDVVTISGVQGNTAANGTFLVAQTTSNSITLGSPVGTQTYISGGYWYQSNPTTAVTITGASGSPIQITSPNTNGLISTSKVSISGVLGNTAANGVHPVSNLTGTTFDLDVNSNGAYTTGTGTWTQVYDITGATDGGEILVTAAGASALSNGDTVSISGVEGTTAANGVFTIGNVTPISFTLDNALGNAAYEENGTWSFAITGASTTAAVITSANSLASGDTVTITGVGGNTTVNGQFAVASANSTSFTLGGPIGSGNYNYGGFWTLPNEPTRPVTGAVNSVSHPGSVKISTGSTEGLQVGDVVFVTGIAGLNGANGVSLVSAVTPTSFTIENATGVGTYTEGGSWKVIHPVTDASNNGQPIVITSPTTAGINQGGVVDVRWVEGNSAANGKFVVTNVTSTSFTLGSPAGGDKYTTGGTWTSTSGSGPITGATNGGRIVISAPNTAGLADKDLIEITGVLGNTAANNVYQISNVTTDASFMLDDSLASGIYTSGGTWKQYTPFTRLISPKDVVESLLSPQDGSALNNYFNEKIDEFFLQYLPSTVTLPGGQVGGGQTFSVVSTASGSSLTYSGTVTNGTVAAPTANGGYVLRLTSSDTTDTTNYDIFYPFFDSNSPSPDVYTPLFPTEAPPSWLAGEVESASQMVFACNAVFADDALRSFAPIPNGNAATIIADLENLISGSFNRGIALNVPSTWDDATQWFPTDGTYNYWVEYWHQTGLTFGDLAYAFAYDDKFGASTNLGVANVGLTQVTLGNWSDTRTQSATGLLVATTLPTPPPVGQNGSVTLTATVSGASTTPSGSVAFFIDGVPINSNNDSNSAPLQLVPIIGGVATLPALLPTLADGTYTYTVTAVYSGDTNFLPSIGTATLQVAG